MNKYQLELLNALGKWRKDTKIEAYNLREARNKGIQLQIDDCEACIVSGEIIDFEIQVSSGYRGYSDAENSEYFIVVARVDDEKMPYDFTYYRIYEIKGAQNV